MLYNIALLNSYKLLINCLSQNSLYLPCLLINSLWLPTSHIFPFSMTTILSAFCIVDNLWAITKTVRLCIACLRPFWTDSSASASKALVASSSNKIVVIEKGKICEVGNHNELIIRQGRYKEFCDKQFIKSF